MFQPEGTDLTIVIAQRRRDDILILSDTMVAEPGKTGPDIMPGRLKAITVVPRVTVAFAGNADAADVAIRAGRRQFLKTGLDGLLTVLKEASRDGHTDFIIASHHSQTSLLRLRNGVALEVSDICTLGDDAPFRAMIEEARDATDEAPLSRGNLRFRFIDRLLTNRDLGDTVGGFPIVTEATSSGHRYLAQSGGYTYKFPTLKWGEETHQPMEQVYTGDGHFEIAVMPSSAADVPVVGVCLLQARTGYVFSLIEHPQAFRVSLAPSNTFWEGNESQMYEVLRKEIEAHVSVVRIDQDGTKADPT